MAGIPKVGSTISARNRYLGIPANTSSSTSGGNQSRISAPGRGARTAHYDSSRIIDRSQIKIVDSIAAELQKTEAEERGDLVADPFVDDGTPKISVSHSPEILVDESGNTEYVNPQVLLAALAAAYFLL